MNPDILGFGCVSLTQHASLRKAHNLLSTAFDEGINHFDTAPLYSNGFSEKILGKFIKNKRSQVTLATKCGLGNFDQPTININIALSLNAIKNKFKKKIGLVRIDQPVNLEFRLIGAEYIKRSLENSLRNLQTDYIDCYLLHEALPEFLTPEAFSFLIEQKQNGVLLELGIAASYTNLLSLTNKIPEPFRILQYEHGPYFKTDELLFRFPLKKHFYHSSLKSIPFLKSKYSNSELAGLLLSRASKFNPSGKILFSTTKIRNLKENINAFEHFGNLSLDELNNILNALY